MAKRHFLCSALLALAPSFLFAADQHLTDAEVVAKIKSDDTVVRSAFSSCLNEHLKRSQSKGDVAKQRERFTFTAICTLKEPEGFCERQDVHASGYIESHLVTVYELKLHLRCED
jgi:hypothetical protein